MTNRRIRAFTLIELMVVVTILALFAAMIVPDFARQKEARARDAFFSDLQNLAVQAREMAISSRQTTAIEASGTGFALMQEPSVDQTSTNNPQPMGAFGNNTDQVSQNNSGSDTSGSEQQIKQLAIPTGITADTFQQGGQPVGQSDWKVQFYSDGTADSGGVQLSSNGRMKSLDIQADGAVKVSEGALPDHTQDSWPAGTYEQRVQQTPNG